MVEKIGDSEHKEKLEWKESDFLSKQLKQMPQRIFKTLSASADNEDLEGKDKKHKTERDVIEDMLYKKSDFLGRRAILGDILSYSIKTGEEGVSQGEEKEVTQFKCKYGLGITVNNLKSLLNFCAVHGFIPLVDKIYIEGQDASKVTELSSLFSFTGKNSKASEMNPQFSWAFGDQAGKLDKTVERASRRALNSLKDIYEYHEKIYPYLMGDNLEKHDDNNIGTSSENIFVEIAIRLENQIREKIGIESSYMFLAGYKNDHDEKTDMHFAIQKTPKQKPRFIPVQFTTMRKRNQPGKEKDLEDYLIKKIQNEDDNTENKTRSHILLIVNGEFAKHLTHHINPNKEKGQENKIVIINEDYKDWINNPQEREKYDGSKFPLFSDRIDPNIIQPAEIIYIALHMLYKKYSFRYTTKETYLNSFKENTEIEKNNPFEINGIKLSDISIGDCSTETIYPDSHFGSPILLKHKFQICYQGKHVGVIVIYEAKQENSN